MTIPVPLGELTGQLTAAARTPGWKQLLCGPDVAATLTATLAPVAEIDGTSVGVIIRLLAVDIIPTPDSPPGTFRLIRHYDPGQHRTTCEVNDDHISHRHCQILLDGTLTPDPT